MTIQDTEVATATDEFQQQWAEWHRAHEEKRWAPHGFLAVTSLNFLDAEPRSFADAPGEWHSGPDGVVVELGPGEELEVDGRRITGRHTFGVLAERSSVSARFGTAEIEVAKRGGYDVVRPRHPDNQRRTSYTGTPVFPARPEWSIDARFSRFDTPRPTTVGAAVDGLEHVYDAVGELTFSYDGKQNSLLAFPGFTDDEVLVLFTDATAGVTTVPSVRSLSVRVEEQRTVVDFNRATNLPCAYTPYATCPLPPRENRLTFEVTAGERLPA